VIGNSDNGVQFGEMKLMRFMHLYGHTDAHI
jgi:hypothetical protein